ncbi:hypothetical protein [Singulisphaera sp. PoT]
MAKIMHPTNCRRPLGLPGREFEITRPSSIEGRASSIRRFVTRV